jgi:hypothetical protein
MQGFETRGTVISRRLTAWENLLEAVSHIGPLTTNPLEARGMISRVSSVEIDPQEILEKKLERKRNRNKNKRRRKNNNNSNNNNRYTCLHNQGPIL